MSRTGVEEKPPWRAVPRPVRGAVDQALGSPVQRAMRIWGGYSPSPTFRLRLADGRRIFFKAATPADTPFAQRALVVEERVYRELSSLISGWAPAFYSALQAAGWHILLLEDLGPKSVPPWSRAEARGVMQAYARFHLSSRGRSFPPWLARPADELLHEGLSWTFGPEVMHGLVVMAGTHAGEAGTWLEDARPVLARATAKLRDPALPQALLHGDTRSDNLRWREGRLFLLDWPSPSVGPAEIDLAAFAQSITVDGGPPPEQLVEWYAAASPVDAAALDGAVAAIAGFFAYFAWRPELPQLPRLRAFQRQQLQVSLSWAARRLGLPAPNWLRAIENR